MVLESCSPSIKDTTQTPKQGEGKSIPKGPTCAEWNKIGMLKGVVLPSPKMKKCKSVHAELKRILNLKNEKHHINLL